jgi:hypothetical protein
MRPLTDKEREAYFPVHIELGKKESEIGGTEMPRPPGTKRGKSRKFYPTIYIDSTPGLEQLPKDGCMLVEFRRKRISIEENGDGDDAAGVTLEIHALCLPADMPAEAAQSLADAFGNELPGKTENGDDEYGED